MAETNIDAVSEFKILTNAYQAEYGRAVGGQVQVVTKSGTQAFHGSGYWYGRRSEWNANTWLNKRATPEVPLPESESRRSRVHRRRSRLPAGPLQRRQAKTLLLLQPGVAEPQRSGGGAGEPVPTALERLGDFSQSVDSGGNPYPFIRDYTTGLPVRSREYQRLLPGRRRPRENSRQSPIPAGPQRARTSIRQANASARQRHQLHQPGADQEPQARRPASLRLPGDRQLACHRPHAEDEERSGAAVRHDVGGRRQQQPRHDRHAVPDTRDQLPGVGDRGPQLDDDARVELGTRAQLARLLGAESAPHPRGRGTERRTAPVPRRRPGRITCRTSASTEDASRRPMATPAAPRLLSDRPRSLHEREHHARRRSPT